jgi:hypothetical protein
MIVETNIGVVAWRPLLGQLGVHDVVLRVSDGKGGVALQSWRITVVPPNSAPVFITLPPSPAVAGLPWEYHVRAQDAEGQALTFQLASNAPAWMALIPQLPNSQLLQWTPTLAQLGANPIEIIVRDEAGAEARQTFDLEVVASAPNRAPQFVTTPRTQTRLNAPYSYTAKAADADGDPLVFSLVSGPGGVHLTPAPPAERGSFNGRRRSWACSRSS